jgi:hypothetical protein
MSLGGSHFTKEAMRNACYIVDASDNKGIAPSVEAAKTWMRNSILKKLV